jgi:Domain of unknown function (DUF1876)
VVKKAFRAEPEPVTSRGWTMGRMKRWSVDIFVDEDDGRTYAEARLQTRDDTHLVGIGRATLNPADLDVPEVGDELAAARALTDLGHRLLLAAVGDIEAITHEPARLSR